MKKLICAAIVAGSMVALAEEAPKAEVAAPAAAEAVKKAPWRSQSSPEQQQKMREMAEKRMAERRAKREAQILEIVKKYVPEEDKAKTLAKELLDVMMPGRRNMMRPPRPPKPSAAKPAKAR